MMRVRHLLALVGILAGAAAATDAQAQVRFAPQVSFGSDSDLGIGARVNFGLTSLFRQPGFNGIASFDYFFPGNNVNYWELNANLTYMIPGVRGNVAPYAGGGFNYGHVSVDNCTGCGNGDVGINLLGGLNFRTRTKLTPFIEGRLALGGGDQFVLTGGLYF